MTTYLLTWNRDAWPWKGLGDCAKRVRSGQEVLESWSCANRSVEVGDRVFLLKQGAEPRGLMASGWVIEPPYPGKPYREPSSNDKPVWYIDFQFDFLLDPIKEKESLLHTSELQKRIRNGPSDFKPRSSGTIIERKSALLLEKLWQSHLDTLDLEPEVSAFEGLARRHFTIHRRREDSLRTAKIDQWLRQNQGVLCCQVPGCGFDFLRIYGEIGRDYAQVHHLVPLAAKEGPRKTSLRDLVVVCANCHAMIHRNGQCRDYLTLIAK